MYNSNTTFPRPECAQCELFNLFPPTTSATIIIITNESEHTHVTIRLVVHTYTHDVTFKPFSPLETSADAGARWCAPGRQTIFGFTRLARSAVRKIFTILHNKVYFRVRRSRRPEREYILIFTTKCEFSSYIITAYTCDTEHIIIILNARARLYVRLLQYSSYAPRAYNNMQ